MGIPNMLVLSVHCSEVAFFETRHRSEVVNVNVKGTQNALQVPFLQGRLRQAEIQVSAWSCLPQKGVINPPEVGLHFAAVPSTSSVASPPRPGPG